MAEQQTYAQLWEQDRALLDEYSRVVARCRCADGRDLSCAILAAGAATSWNSYWRRHRMPGCRTHLSP